MMAGNTVIDREVVTRTSAEGPKEIDVVDIVEIHAGRIAKAWFRIGAKRLA
jgi:putative hydrolase of HD superfamily